MAATLSERPAEKSAEAVVTRLRSGERRAESSSQGAVRTNSMGVKRQQGSGDQKDLFDEALQASLRHGVTGEGGTRSGAFEELQASAAWERQRALTQHLMEQVASSSNLNLAYKRVKAN